MFWVQEPRSEDEKSHSVLNNATIICYLEIKYVRKAQDYINI